MPENTSQQPNSSIQERKCPEFARYAAQEIVAAIQRAICLPIEPGDARKLAIEVKWLQYFLYAERERNIATIRDSQRLEQERDAARAELVETQQDRDRLIQQRDQVMRERDEARSTLDLIIPPGGLSGPVSRPEFTTLKDPEQLWRFSELQLMPHPFEKSSSNGFRCCVCNMPASHPIHRDQDQKRDDGYATLAAKVENLGYAFEALITQMNSTSGFDPAVLRARLRGER